MRAAEFGIGGEAEEYFFPLLAELFVGGGLVDEVAEVCSFSAGLGGGAAGNGESLPALRRIPKVARE